MVLDVFSKYGWIVPLKDTKGETVAEALKTILKEGRKPQYLWTDKGKEYFNKHVKELLDKNKITLYSTENEEKSSVCERWNRTIKTKMWEQFTVQGNTMYIDMLPKLVEQYNNTKHSSIKMTPVEASKKKNEGSVYFNLYGDMETLKQKPKFKVGDKVRISKYKRKVSDKAYKPNWSEEVFTVDKIQSAIPITYKIKDLNNEEIKGSFYEPELLKTQQEVFRVDKVIRRDYKKKQALIQLQNTRKAIEYFVNKQLKEMKGLKYVETIKVVFNKMSDGKIISKTAYFNSTPQTIINHVDITNSSQLSKQQILNKIAQWISEGSGWAVQLVDGHYINIVKHHPLKGTSYIQLPKELQNSKKGLINMKNKDNECFRWCHMRHSNPKENNPKRIKNQTNNILKS